MKKIFLTLIACSAFASAWALTTITTKNVPGSPFCGGTAIMVTFNIDGPANPGNTWTAQLSDKNGSFASPVNIGTLAGTTAGPISATIPSGTKTGTKYKVRVVSSNPAVIGSPTAKTLKINPKPTDLATSNITSCQVKVSWTGTSTASSYKLQYKLTSSSNWSGTIDAGLATNYTFTGLKSSSSYDFQVRSSCANGDKSDWSKISASTTACPMPTGFIVTDFETTTTDLNWNDASCATDYSLRYRLYATPTWTYKHPVTSDYHMTGLFPGSLYEAQVATRCSATDSSVYTDTIIWETKYFRLSGDVDLASSFTVFPNPSNGDFTVQFTATDETGEVGVTVQNIYGQVVYDGTLKTTSGVNEQRISLNHAAQGMYFVTIKSGDKEFRQSVLVK